ncbi:MAG: acylphosphatase [Pyrinomonadaceae bacterium]
MITLTGGTPAFPAICETASKTANLLFAASARLMIARRFFISGNVQGVGYRYFAQRAAAKHQIRGFVANLADGRVEVLAEATEKAVADFRNDLAAGPAYSRVSQVEELVVEPSGRYSNFRIER